MSKKNKLLHTIITILIMASVLFPSMVSPLKTHAASSLGFVILNSYSKTLKIGDEFYLAAVTSNGKKPTFKSSSSKTASVSTYGKVTAKKAGTAIITVKTKNAEASCTIKVQATKIQLSAKHISLENGYSAQLNAAASTGHAVTFRSSKKSIAVVDEHGKITAKKPGTATITATADQSCASCTVTVKKPRVSLNKSSVSLYRKRMVCLAVKSSSKSTPKWKSSKKSVAVVDSNGMVTAVKNGTAVITVTIDGVSKNCKITVKKPTVTFETNEVILAVGKKKTVKVSVSSGNKPIFSSSNTCIATVDEHGTVTAQDVGKAYIYASEDGVKCRMRVIVKQK